MSGDGIGVGDPVGDSVGEAVGTPVGMNVGIAVGDPVGEPVGDAVGISSGDMVGAAPDMMDVARFDAVIAEMPGSRNMPAAAMRMAFLNIKPPLTGDYLQNIPAGHGRLSDMIQRRGRRRHSHEPLHRRSTGTFPAI